MNKLVMVLAILTMAGAASLGVMNMKTLQNEQKELGIAKNGIRDAKEEHGKVDDSLVTANEDRRSAKDQRDDTTAQLSVMNNTVGRQNSQIEGLRKSVDVAQLKKKEIDLALNEIGANTVEELEKNVQAQKDTLANRQNEQQEVMGDMEDKNKEVVMVEDGVRELQRMRVEQAKNVALNGLEATVIAVNRDWGFVMVNVGKALGVSPETSLLIKRGGERIARMRITDLSDEVLMAEVIEGSVSEGVSVSPGDQVILENPK
jgi:hypothetical protein